MHILSVLITSFIFLSSCSSDSPNMEDSNSTDSVLASEASITRVSFTGEPSAYTFSVEISSPDTGCNQYANWWEIISENGSTLIYRRILGHSHVNEQPFTRSGGLVDVKATDVVIVRAHMNTSGYGKVAYKGSISNGFTEEVLPENFSSSLALEQPLPSNCAF